MGSPSLQTIFLLLDFLLLVWSSTHPGIVIYSAHWSEGGRNRVLKLPLIMHLLLQHSHIYSWKGAVSLYMYMFTTVHSEVTVRSQWGHSEVRHVLCFTYLTPSPVTTPRGHLLPKSASIWLSINEGIQGALASIISCCANKEGTRQKGQERLKSDMGLWLVSISARKNN